MATAAEALTGATRMLEHARFGLADFEAGGERVVSGMYQAITSGRSVTFALQNMRGQVEGFDEWWAVMQQRLSQNPVARWAVDLRNRMEKQGSHGDMGVSMFISHIDDKDLEPMMRQRPPGAQNMFIGDQLGRCGWEVELPDGSTQQVYAAAPSGLHTRLFLEDAPDGRDVGDLLREYVALMGQVIDETAAAFA